MFKNIFNFFHGSFATPLVHKKALITVHLYVINSLKGAPITSNKKGCPVAFIKLISWTMMT